ncbi:hypothetical protein KIN20_035496 [Parelaphostrongylus tenuis]|uniref:Uncharacterized protein n=1 Tax=Parelaphostrongylus tenuis TaxID=148309 RepID=A0AAD5REI9_PARTN|nr:hypothetical protein KIN20_035496 [Parelaphostrongylus tenuis]
MLDDAIFRVSNARQNGLARGIYHGICNFAKAEEDVERRADFKLYHEMKTNSQLDDLEPDLVLTLFYKTRSTFLDQRPTPL